MQREVRGAQPVVDPYVDGQVGIVCPAGIGLVDGTRIGAGAEMARTAGLDAVAANLHVPEQGLTQSDGGAPISYIGGKFGNVSWAAGLSGFPGRDCCPGTAPVRLRTSPHGRSSALTGKLPNPEPAPGRRRTPTVNWRSSCLFIRPPSQLSGGQEFHTCVFAPHHVVNLFEWSPPQNL